MHRFPTPPTPLRHFAALFLVAAAALFASQAIAAATYFTGFVAPAAGYYRAGTAIDIGVKYSGAVTVTGTPRLRLTAGGQTVFANYRSGSGSAQLTFRYTVAYPTNAPSLSIVLLELNGGTLRDSSGIDVDPMVIDDGFLTVIDTTAPSVTAVRRFLPAEPNSAGNTFVFRASFSEPVNTPPTNAFTIVRSGVSGGTIESIRGSGTEWYVTVAGVATGYGQLRLDVNGGLVTDLAGNAAQAFSPGETVSRLGASFVAWGDNTSNQINAAGGNLPNATTPPTGAIGSQSVSRTVEGRSHTLVLTREGNLFAWGNGADGKLGNLTNNSSSTPVAVKMDGGLAGQNVLTIAAGADHNVVLSRTGVVFSWGRNDRGQLGKANTDSYSQPVYVEDTGSPMAGKSIVAIAAGNQHTLALSADGRIFAWGDNTYGQLGNGASGATAFSTVPVAVDTTGVLAGKHIVAISAGGFHSLALSSDGQLYAWGSNGQSQLGIADATLSAVPVSVLRGATNGRAIVEISAGFYHNLVRTADGLVCAWGGGQSGELGIMPGLVASATLPTVVVQTGALAGRTVVALAAGASFSRALTADGAAFAWGYNSAGQLGKGTIDPINNAGSPNNTPAPVRIIGPLDHGAVFHLGASSAAWHSLALAHGRASTYMVNTGIAGTYGSGANLDLILLFSENVTVTGTPSLRLGLVNRYATATYLSGSGTNALTFRYTVQPGDWAPSGITSIDFDPTGTSDRYGFAADYQLPASTNLSGLKIDARAPHALTTKRAQPYAVREEAATTTASALIYRVLFDKVVTGVDPTDFTLATTGTATGAVANILGTGSERFVVVTGVSGSGAIRLDLKPTGTGITDTVGNALVGGCTSGEPYYHAGTTTVVAWGYNNLGQCGSSNAGGNVLAPALLFPAGALAGRTVATVSSGYAHSLALCADGTLAAWGENNYGELGCDYPDYRSLTPVAVTMSGALSGKTVVAIATGTSHCLALTSDGRVYAWGDNSSGQLGNGTSSTTPVTTPVAVSTSGSLSGKEVVAIAAGGMHSLALTADGLLFAWGSDNNGQLGNGYAGSSTTPAAVDTTGTLADRQIVAITAGALHSLALDSGGLVHAWGSNSSGQIGNSGYNDAASPALVDFSSAAPGGTATIVALAAGENHCLALGVGGALYAWGDNNRRQLGDGTSDSLSRLPVAVDLANAGAERLVAIAAGNSHSLATTATGTLFGWGDNYSYQLGSALPYTVETPAQIASGMLAGADIVALPGGSRGNHSVVLTNAGGDPLTAVEHWRLHYFDTPFAERDAVDTADPDADDRTNFVEYATGSDPINADSAPVAALALSGTGSARRLTLTFGRILDPQITYTVEASDTLAAGSWTTIWSETGYRPAGNWTVTDPEFMSGHTRRFLRLRIVRTP